jgi:phage tail sheath gpL-like
MALTNIGIQKTPGDPIEIVEQASTSTPPAVAVVLIIAHAASGATGTNTIVTINNSGDPVAGGAEADTKFGVGSEAAKAVRAAINANADISNSNFPPLLVMPLDSADASIAMAAQNAILQRQGQLDFITSPYDLSANATVRAIMKNLAATLSGASRTQMQQYGTIGVGAARNADPSTLFKMDTQFLSGVWHRDTTGLNPYSLAELAAAAAAEYASNSVPFNPLDSVVVGGVTASTNPADYPTVGASLESETCLNQGWTPLKTNPNGDVAFVRTVTGRLTVNGAGAVPVNSYIDVQDWQVLYYWRKTLAARFGQPDLTQTKASTPTARNISGEIIRLAQSFEDQNMFQAVAQLAKFFVIQRNASDRSRFDVQTPVNVIPGLHVIAAQIQASTLFDVITL